MDRNSQKISKDCQESEPLVSVNICTHNRSKIISKAIESVLLQDYSSIEIIVSDDGDDNTPEIVSKIKQNNTEWATRIHYYKNVRSGIPQNRNFAMEKSKGKYIAILDSDDYWISPTKITQQIKFLTDNPDHILVGTDAIIINNTNEKTGELITKKTDERIRSDFLLKNNFINSSTVFLKQEKLKYDERFPYISDYDFFLKLAKLGKVANINEKHLAYRNHDSNVSNTKRRAGVVIGFKIIYKHRGNYPRFYLGLMKNCIRYVRTFF